MNSSTHAGRDEQHQEQAHAERGARERRSGGSTARSRCCRRGRRTASRTAPAGRTARALGQRADPRPANGTRHEQAWRSHATRAARISAPTVRLTGGTRRRTPGRRVGCDRSRCARSPLSGPSVPAAVDGGDRRASRRDGPRLARRVVPRQQPIEQRPQPTHRDGRRADPTLTGELHGEAIDRPVRGLELDPKRVALVPHLPVVGAIGHPPLTKQPNGVDDECARNRTRPPPSARALSAAGSKGTHETAWIEVGAHREEGVSAGPEPAARG
jgi:hypothetical protein